jgi:hypothetical protein
MQNSEKPLLAKWLWAHKNVNRVDSEIFRKQQVRLYAVEDEDGIICFIPVAWIYRLDALAPQPGVDSERLKKAFYAMNDFLWNQAQAENVCEVLVQPNDERFARFLKNRLGFESFVPEVLRLNYNQPRKSETPIENPNE